MFTERELPNQTGYFRHVQYSLDKNIDAYVTVFNDKIRAKIFLQPMDNQWAADHLNEMSKQHDFIVGINGGFYTTTFQPAGLFIQNGMRIRPLARSTLLTTCVRVNSNQKIYLEKNRENCLNAYSAMQTGPLIIDQGEISDEVYPANRVKLNSFFNENRRTILAESTDHQIIAMVTTSATLSHIANILKKYPESFGVKKIKTAIDLDGGSSTGMYVRFAQEPFYFFEQRHVKTLIFFY
ncbi:MAG TPA: phosphodiester glycosidase family protein [Gammaproteobacteria bacterium]|nr:phosphodiester glycosidase family protein [Gammaproteobacteria bacterium]